MAAASQSSGARARSTKNLPCLNTHNTHSSLLFSTLLAIVPRRRRQWLGSSGTAVFPALLLTYARCTRGPIPSHSMVDNASPHFRKHNQKFCSKDEGALSALSPGSRVDVAGLRMVGEQWQLFRHSHSPIGLEAQKDLGAGRGDFERKQVTVSGMDGAGAGWHRDLWCG